MKRKSILFFYNNNSLIIYIMIINKFIIPYLSLLYWFPMSWNRIILVESSFFSILSLLTLFDSLINSGACAALVLFIQVYHGKEKRFNIGLFWNFSKRNPHVCSHGNANGLAISRKKLREISKIHPSEHLCW